MTTLVSTWKIAANGALQKLEQPDARPQTLNAASLLLPEGVYTTFRTYAGGKIQPLEGHIRRLEESARLLGQPLALDRERILDALRRAYPLTPGEEARVRLTVDLSREPGAVYLSLEPLALPTGEDYRRGVRVATCPYRRENPRAKRTAFIRVGEEFRRELPPGTNECLLVGEDGRILEGLSSNFFAWLRGELWTAEQGVLAGLIRARVLEAARALGLPVRLEGLPQTALPELQEAFITSSSRLILPVRQVDEVVVGGGAPGAVTQRLMKVIEEEVRRDLVAL